MKLNVLFSFGNCLRHAFMTGAGYGDLQRIEDADIRRWCEYDPPEVGAFKTMETVLEMPKHAENLALWVEGALSCKEWEWSPDQFDAALQALNAYRADAGLEPFIPPSMAVKIEVTQE